MNTNIVLFRGNVAAPALRQVWANSPKATIVQVSKAAQSPGPGRNVLIAIWRKNLVSGRLECRWITERSAATDEGVSCEDVLRRAA